ncbi:MAG: helix-turn-helix transcriptional regulator [Spirochaetes bacterium]|nr:helix-turn-helix transcriptional regulator [Spirochaetota bacterium]
MIRYLSEKPRFDGGDLVIRGLGIREPMRAGLVDRPAGTGDRLLMYFHSACQIADADGRELRPPGSLVLWPSGGGHFYGNRAKRWVHSWVHCDGRALARWHREEGVPENRVIEGFPQADFEAQLRSIHRELSRPDGADGVILGNLFHNLYRGLRRHLRPLPAAPAALEAVRLHLEEHFRAPVAVAELAQWAGYSVPHFTALWRRQYGVAPLRFLIRLRLSHAAYLLRDRNLSIGEAASRSGFEDLYYFSRLFRRHYGDSPRAWRRGQWEGAAGFPKRHAPFPWAPPGENVSG